MSGSELVAEAMRVTGSQTPADLARVLGLDSYESPRRVKRWMAGKCEPTYEMTLKLLALCQLPGRELEHVVPIRGSEQPPQDAEVLEHIVRQLERFERVIEQQTALLERVAGELELLKQGGDLRGEVDRTAQ